MGKSVLSMVRTDTYLLLFTLRLIQPGADNILQADHRDTSALGEVFSSLVSAACRNERKRVCMKNIASAGRHLHD